MDRGYAGKSCATPKTHTPDSPVKERGARFYSPEISKWVNRDPIEEWGGIDLYVATQNNLVNLVDPFGLEWCAVIGGVKVCFGGPGVPEPPYIYPPSEPPSPKLPPVPKPPSTPQPWPPPVPPSYPKFTCYGKNDIPSNLYPYIPNWVKKALDKTCCAGVSLCVSVQEVENPDKSTKSIYGFGVECKY